MIKRTSRVVGTLASIVWPLIVPVIMWICTLCATPPPDLACRQWLAFVAVGLLIGYSLYHVGWLIGHGVGWREACSEFRPNRPADRAGEKGQS